MSYPEPPPSYSAAVKNDRREAPRNSQEPRSHQTYPNSGRQGYRIYTIEVEPRSRRQDPSTVRVVHSNRFFSVPISLYVVLCGILVIPLFILLIILPFLR